MLCLCLVAIYLPPEIKRAWQTHQRLGAVKCKLLGNVCHTNVFLKLYCSSDGQTLNLYALLLHVSCFHESCQRIGRGIVKNVNGIVERSIDEISKKEFSVVTYATSTF